VFMEFCYVPKGTAQLGSPKAEREEVMKQTGDKEEPDWLKSEAEGVRGKYEEKAGFWLGKYAVTQGEWVGVMGTTPFAFHKDGTDKDYRDRVAGLDTTRFPAEQVRWDDICGKLGAGGDDTFLGKLNARAGVAKAFGGKAKFVLPHEDRWEYACRGGKGNKQAYYWGNELTKEVANVGFVRRTTVVGSYEKAAPHPWGLCDMIGNV